MIQKEAGNKIICVLCDKILEENQEWEWWENRSKKVHRICFRKAAHAIIVANSQI